MDILFLKLKKIKTISSNERIDVSSSQDTNEFSNAKIAWLTASNILLGLCFVATPVIAEDYFNLEALELKDGAQTEVDLKQFANAGGQLPGVYHVDMYLNGRQVDTRDITFIDADGKLQPELAAEQLQAMGVKIDAFPLLSMLKPEQKITDIGSAIPEASTRFDFNQQRLDISMPQAALNIEARNAVDPALWDQGMTALKVNYSYSGAKSQILEGGSQARDTNSNFLNLRSSLNVAAWRLNNYSTYTTASNNSGRWQSINNYLQRDIQSLKSQLTLGDSMTPSDVFDSVQFRGAQLQSDDSMLPDSLRGFAPIIRGIARSNAQVTVRQGGYVIYQTYVAPGAFAINDLYPTASSGDLEVIIREVDGSERVSYQPFSAVPIMQREGQWKYGVTAGQYRTSNSSGSTPTFAQGSLIYGLPWASTVYSGLQGAENYTALLAGIGHSFGDWGSLSADISQANAQLRDGSNHSGQSLRFQYAKNVAATGTSFTLAGYRYSTSGFYDMQEANEVNIDDESWRLHYNKRSKALLNLSQSLGDYGSIYIAASQQDYWRQTGKERNISSGYSLNYGGVVYGLNYSYNQTPNLNDNDRQISFNLAVPLDKFLAGSWARYGVVNSKLGGTSQNAGISGTMLDDRNLSYQLQQTLDASQRGYGGDMRANYKGAYGDLSAGYNYDKFQRQLSYGAQGSIVAHPYGVTLGQQVGETAVLVRAPDAQGIKIENNVGVKTDWRGYAVVPYATNYRENRIGLDTNSFSGDMDIDNAAVSVVPTRGALVLADFKTRVGSRALITLRRNNGVVPFGATASLNGDKDNSSIVGDEGQVYLRGVPDKGTLNVKWGDGASQHCTVAFTLPINNEENSSIKTLTAQCE